MISKETKAALIETYKTGERDTGSPEVHRENQHPDRASEEES